jgi:hypothetical protein
VNILCSFPGRSGDILWALPAIRALSRRLGQPVDLLISGKYGSLALLLEQQPYIGRCWGDPLWKIEETAPISPRTPEWTVSMQAGGYAGYDAYFHLGYRGWPARPLPFETLDCLNDCIGRATGPSIGGFLDRELALDEPWITTPAGATVEPRDIAVGFTDEWIELKMGLLFALGNQGIAGAVRLNVLTLPHDRKSTEWFGPCACDYDLYECRSDWLNAAWVIANSRLFLGCCSALHVLAVALGKRVILVEPNPARHHDCFYPLGKTGRVQLLLGSDGLPTNDARHCKDAIQAALQQVSA